MTIDITETWFSGRQIFIVAISKQGVLTSLTSFNTKALAEKFIRSLG